MTLFGESGVSDILLRQVVLVLMETQLRIVTDRNGNFFRPAPDSTSPDLNFGVGFIRSVNEAGRIRGSFVPYLFRCFVLLYF